MTRSSTLSLAALSAALLLSLSANAHDPRQFDRLMDAGETKPKVTACAELAAMSKQQIAAADAEVKSVQQRCEAEKKAKAKPAAHAGH